MKAQLGKAQLRTIVGLPILAFCATLCAGSLTKTKAAAAYAGLPLVFEANLGQADRAARFLNADAFVRKLARDGSTLIYSHTSAARAWIWPARCR